MLTLCMWNESLGKHKQRIYREQIIVTYDPIIQRYLGGRTNLGSCVGLMSFESAGRYLSSLRIIFGCELLLHYSSC